MADTTFVNGITLTDSDWFNDVNRLQYTIFGDPATIAAVKTTVFGTPYPVNHGPVMRAAADQSITTNTTLASATNLSFAIAASEEWVADFWLDLGVALATTGFKIAVTVPSGATLNADMGMMASIDVAGTNNFQNRTTTSGTDFGRGAAATTNAGDALVLVSVWVLNSTNAGTVQLQIAQATSSGTALVLRKGSHGVATRIA